MWLTLMLALSLAMGVGGYKLMDEFLRWADRPVTAEPG